jgi:hypothetical protein
MEREETNVYIIPANYTDSGKWLGGLLTLRNTIETIVLLVGLGYIEVAFIPMSQTVRIIVMVLTMLPLGLITLMGIDGDSLFQYLGHIFRFWKRKRKLHFSKEIEIDE